MENPAKKSNHSILTIKNDHVVHFAAYYFIRLHLYTFNLSHSDNGYNVIQSLAQFFSGKIPFS